jgi:hypothetical protein
MDSRTATAASSPRITSEMVGLYKRCREIVAAGGERSWEEDGGHRAEFLELSVILHHALGRKPWQENVCDVVDSPGKPPADEDVRSAVALRRQLEKAAGG